ncbi:protein mono-ADP-ribosyltransferase PARP9-like [Xyrauchen texanus]|uniref:protein mono-ADP-ribosyltransferase PARP9-like n=1 Tax=Xyrauchen texanus TaxID=154827 RepID=UPI0022426428|nr:protein mono-ADP-ribosyltransferase PARP9-like [Xyrauchen texanus]XP_051998369.1 protein mono-ADP-ribosyltransferase PARP9-like [Xyrauchen texanus]XP_051998370.1 protein mono-ADP-ribosyltransferase PARP9-like [Xyrauchen texanus]
MTDETHVPLTPEHTGILRDCKSAFCNAVKAKFDCTAIFHNMECDTFGSNLSDVSSPDVRYSTKLPSGVEVSVWKDDLTRHKVEAVVNAANEKLNHAGGLALALCNAGGPMIQQWSDEILKGNKIVPTGDAVITASGSLPCKMIIHAVGPRLNPNPSQSMIDYAAPSLRQTILRILELVLQNNVNSVAIPALSSGLFNFPRHLCADIIVKTIRELEEFGTFKSRKLEIRLVNNDEPSVNEMHRASWQILGPPTSDTYSGAVNGRNQRMATSSNNSLQIGNVTMHLKKGHIEEEKVDVIVNTIANDCNLSKGDISKAILKKAGKKIQEEIFRNTGKHWVAKNGEIYDTKGHNLDCKYVLHSVCAFRSEPKAKEILFRVVSDCLKKASLDCKSISFPAIGTGLLGFKKQEVAQIMTDAVVNFGKSNTGKKLDICFVVYPKDDEMMKAFEKEICSKKGGTTSPELPSDLTKNFRTNETPTIEFSGVSDEALREAKAWTFQMLSLSKYTLTIKNNHVIYLGQTDHENLLSLQAKFGVHIKVFFRSGNGGISITGDPKAVSCVGFEVESMLCKAQEDFALAEENAILYSVVRWHSKDVPCLQMPEISSACEKAYLAGNKDLLLNDINIKVNLKHKNLVDSYGRTSNVERTCLLSDYDNQWEVGNSFYARTTVTRNVYDDKETRRAFEDCKLSIIKAEKMENIALQQLFEMNGRRVKDKPKKLYQCVSAQFCDLICRVGFQKAFAPPTEQKYGSGIYFCSTLNEALRLWKGQNDEQQYIYIIQAQVLTGKSTAGSPDLILPPAIDGVPLDRYDSVANSSKQTHVIFCGQQALPEYLFICRTSSPV